MIAVPSAAATHTATATVSPTPTATPLACWSQSRRMDESSESSDLLKLPMEYRVFLPPCYDEQPDRRYPVLYLIHGQNFNHDQWDRLGADDLAQSLIAKGEIAPFILVLPRDRSWAQPDEDMFGRVMVEELIPTIDGQYRTLEDRSSRAVGGLSRGAAWAVHLGLSHPELFSAIGAHSLPVFWYDTSRIRGWLDAIPEESMPRIFMDTGEKDYLIRSTLWFEELLTEKSIPHEWYLFSGYHEEAYWASHLEQYLRWYAEEW